MQSGQLSQPRRKVRRLKNELDYKYRDDWSSDWFSDWLIYRVGEFLN